jgi:tetratricopeptide (TPR) repeat protein
MALVREQVVQTAEKYVSRGKIEPAIREYRKLLAENPNDINTLNRIGDLYARINRIDEAVDFFFQIADRYSVEGFFVKAIAIYKKIIKLNPTRLDVYENLAELYHRQGLVNEARTQYQVLADYYVKHANAASAIAIYQKMAELEPNNPTYHVRLAEIYREQQLLEKAIHEYRLIAEMMLEHERPQEAAQVYERALDIDASDLDFIREAVSQLRAAGHDAGAARFLAIATERNPAASAIAHQAPPPRPREHTATGAVVVPPATPAAVAAPAPALEARPMAPPPSAPAAPAAKAPPAAPVEPPKPARPSPPPPPAAVREVEAAGDETVFMGSADLDFAAITQAMEAASVVEAAGLAAARAEPEEPGEIEIDLDDVFVLDIEEDDEAEPASLVRPPPDMLGEEPRRPAWAREEEAPAAPAAPEAPPALPKAARVAPPPPAAPATPAATAAAPAVDEETAPSREDFSRYFDLSSPPELPDIAPPELTDMGGLDLESGVFELEVELEEEEPEEAAQLTPALNIDADLLERTASELHGRTVERDEDLVSEAEVLAKYGLEEKALERLREAIRLRPTNLSAYALSLQILVDKGRRGRVVELANEMARVARELGDRDVWPRSRKLLSAAGYRVEGDHVSQAPAAEVAGVALPEIEEPDFAATSLAEMSLPEPGLEEPVREEAAVEKAEDALFAEPLFAELPAMEPPAAAHELFEPRLEIPPLVADLELALEAETVPETVPEIAAAPVVPPPAEPVPLPAAKAKPAPTTPVAPGAPAAPPVRRKKGGDVDQMLSSLLEERPAAARAKPAPRPPAAPPAAAAPPPAPPQAPAAMAAPQPSSAPAAGGAALFNPLEIGEMIEAEEIDWGPEGAAAGAGQGAGAALDDTGMSWLDEAEKVRHAEPPKGGQSFFDEEADFFDLAGELEQELSREEVFQAGALMPAEQSLEDIVEGFKRGVAEHLSPTDFDTHFNLGIAYREMGLLDEAIGEFQLAAKDPGHLVLCCSMLGLCFQDKGMPELAAKWYRKGLEAPGIAEEDHLGLLYDLGNALETAGDRDGAYKTFVDLYGVDSNYRDVVARVEELGPGR